MKKTVAYVARRMLPILIGFFPVGMAYGMLMQSIQPVLLTGA